LEDDLTKQTYLVISEVCLLLGLTPRAVRYYEQRELIWPGRDKHGVRRFTDLERRRLADIARFRRAGVCIEDIRAILEAPQDSDGGAERTALATAKLEAQRAALARRQLETERLLAEVAAGSLMRKIGGPAVRLKLAIA